MPQHSRCRCFRSRKVSVKRCSFTLVGTKFSPYGFLLLNYVERDSKSRSGKNFLADEDYTHLGASRQPCTIEIGSSAVKAFILYVYKLLAPGFVLSVYTRYIQVIKSTFKLTRPRRGVPIWHHSERQLAL